MFPSNIFIICGGSIGLNTKNSTWSRITFGEKFPSGGRRIPITTSNNMIPKLEAQRTREIAEKWRQQGKVLVAEAKSAKAIIQAAYRAGEKKWRSNPYGKKSDPQRKTN
jgi:hypothetical protein